MYFTGLDYTQSKSVLESHMSLKQKRYGEIKGWILSGGNKHRAYISKEDSISATVST